MSFSRLVSLTTVLLVADAHLAVGQVCTPGLHEDQVIYPFAEWPTPMQHWPLTPGMGFGSSIAIHGTTAVIGAPAVDNPLNSVGRVFARRFDGIVWTPHQVLISPDGVHHDWFGISVALSPDGVLMIVGALNHNAFMVNNGAAYIFRLDAESDQWVFEKKLVPGDGGVSDEFGRSVAITSTHAVVGAPLDDASGSDSGSTYVFGYDGTTWSQQAKLVAADGASVDWFGGDVAIVDQTILIGAQRNDHASINAGAAYVFTFDAAQ